MMTLTSLKRLGLYCLCAIVVLGSCGVSPGAQNYDDEDDSDVALGEAVADMRNIDPTSLSRSEQQRMGRVLEDAWNTLIEAGEEGANQLLAEMESIRDAEESDDFFVLAACAVLWEIGELDYAEEIAEGWEYAEALSTNYNYVFYTAFAAAMTHDAQALPMLSAILRDTDGQVFLQFHSMTLQYPWTHEFIWGAFGPTGVPALQQILADDEDDTQVESAINLLALYQCVEALPDIRELAASETSGVRRAAVRALGTFGHPDDYDQLIQALDSEDPEVLWSVVWGMYEYGDLRAASHIAPLIHTEDEALLDEVLGTLLHLVTPAAMDALLDYIARDGVNPRLRDAIGQRLDEIFARLGTDRSAYLEMSDDEKTELLDSLYPSDPEDAESEDEEDTLTPEQLERIMQHWIEGRRLTSSCPGVGSVDLSRVVREVGLPGIARLHDVRAALYERLSDECMSEVRRMNRLLRALCRSQYRREVGVCREVQGIE